MLAQLLPAKGEERPDDKRVLFRTYENTSFSNYLTMLRIEQAKKILNSDPGAYIKNVAERVGYGDQFYFSRIFRSVVGICPSEYCDDIKTR